MLISDLVPFAVAAINGPGSEFVDPDDDESWEIAVSNAFWTARLKGFFPGWRVDENNTEILNIDDPGEEFDRVGAQIIVLFAVNNVLRAKLTGLATKFRAKAGPVESETQRSAQVLVELLKTNQRELEEIVDELSTSGSSLVTFADMVLDRMDAGGPTWLV